MTTIPLRSGVACKQAPIQDGALSVAKTALLQSTLDVEATTETLTTGLASMRATTQDGDMTTGKTSLLRSPPGRQGNNERPHARASWQAGPAQRWDLSIAVVSGLQSELDD